jgi:hypothetical protein
MKSKSFILFLFGLLLFTFPFALLFREPLGALGLPPFYVYLFVSWGLFIALLYLLSERS